jgi:UDP-N-acetylglucosamine 2-epimerase
VGTDRTKILQEAEDLLAGGEEKGGRSRVANPFGDGRAGERIADIVTSHLTGRPRDTEDWSGP